MRSAFLALLFLAFVNSFIIFQFIIYSPFYVEKRTDHILEPSTVNLFIGLLLTCYSLGLVIGYNYQQRITDKYGYKTTLMLNAICNTFLLLLLNFATNIFQFMFAYFMIAVLGYSYKTIVLLMNELSNNRKGFNSNLCTNLQFLLHQQNENLYFMQIAHNSGCMFAGIIGGVFGINSSNVNIVVGTFSVGAFLSFIAIFVIHSFLSSNIDDYGKDYGVQKTAEVDDEEYLLSEEKNDDENINFDDSDSSDISIHEYQTLESIEKTTSALKKFLFTDIFEDQNNEHTSFYYAMHYIFTANKNGINSDSTNIRMLFFLIWLAIVLLFACIFSFDILFPMFASISNAKNGMGFSVFYLGIFYTFYSFVCLVFVYYRHWRLHNGQSFTTQSFTFNSLNYMKFFAGNLMFIYLVIIPWCINSPAIHHSEHSPHSWILITFLIAVLMAYVTIHISYHIPQLLHDFIAISSNSLSSSSAVSSSDALQMIIDGRSSDLNVQMKEKEIIGKRKHLRFVHYCIFVIVNNSMIYLRLILPLFCQWLFNLGLYLNSTLVKENLNSNLEWYQIGNFVFYFLGALAFIAFLLISVFDRLQKSQYSEAIEMLEMARLIREVRYERKQLLMNKDLNDDEKNDIQVENDGISVKKEIEDENGFGFWLTLNMKNILISPNMTHFLACCPPSNKQSSID